MSQDVAKIARGLSRAQRRALLRRPCPSWWGNKPACMPPRYGTAIALNRLGLCVTSGSQAWPLTDLGISVRSYLIEQEKGR